MLLSVFLNVLCNIISNVSVCQVVNILVSLIVPPSVQPRSLSLQPNHAATLDVNHAATLDVNNFSGSAAGNPKFVKERAQSLAIMGATPHTPDNLYSLAGQDATYGQRKSCIPLSDYFEQSGIAQTRRSEGDSRTSIASVTSNGPPAGISLTEALSMKGYGTLGQCTVGPAVPPRTPLNEALQIKGFSQMPVSEGDSASSTVSIVKEAEMEVKRMLRQQSLSEVQVKPGTPLNEALAQKGIINSPGGEGFRSSWSSASISGSVPDDEPEDLYNVPRNNQPAFFPEDDISPPPRYQSLPRRLPEGHYQSPRSLMDDSPDQVYNVPPPPRPAPVPRTSPSRKKRSTLLSQSLKDNNSETTPTKVNGTSAPPVINRSIKPRPPPVNRNVKPGRSESFKNDIPQMTNDSVHYVSLSKLREESKPVPRPRGGIKKSDYSEVDLEGTLAMEKKFTIKEETPRVPEQTRDSLVDIYSSDDDDSTGSEISYTKMRVSDIPICLVCSQVNP